MSEQTESDEQVSDVRWTGDITEARSSYGDRETKLATVSFVVEITCECGKTLELTPGMKNIVCQTANGGCGKAWSLEVGGP